MLPPPVRISRSSTPTSSANSTPSVSAWFPGSGRRTRRKSTWATSISACCSSTNRTPARPISNCRSSRLIWTSRGCSRNSGPTKSTRHSQACDQPIELVGNHPPIAQPIAREAHHHVGCVDAPFVETDTRHWTGAIAGAAHEKTRCWLIIDQILALIGCALAECDHGQSSRAGRGFGGGIAWIDGQRAVGRGKRVAGGGDGHEHARECLQRFRHRVGCWGLRVRIGRLERGPLKSKIDALLRAWPALHRHANGSRRQVEGDTRDGNRQGRGIESRRRPARPQYIADIDERRERDRRKYDERQQKLTRPAPAPAQMPAALLADVNRSHGMAGGPANQSPLISPQ